MNPVTKINGNYPFRHIVDYLAADFVEFLTNRRFGHRRLPG
jgi:hypothetical protein